MAAPQKAASYHPAAPVAAPKPKRPKATVLPRASCPTIFIPAKVEKKTKLFALPVISIRTSIECHVSTVFATVVGTWVNLAKYEADCVFALPTEGVVTNVEIQLTAKDGTKRTMETIIVPKEIAEQFAGVAPEEKKKELDFQSTETQATEEEEEEELAEGKLPRIDYERYEPGMFKLPISGFRSGERAVVKVSFMEPLKFYDGNYQFKLPLGISSALLHNAAAYKDDLNKVLQLDVKINSASSKSKIAWQSPSHTCKIRKQEDPGDPLHMDVDFSAPHKALTQPSAQVEGQEAKKVTTGKLSYDFELSFNFEQDEILPSLIVKSSKEEGSNEGHLMLFVTPPKDQTGIEPTPRDFFFLLDKSGSMTGKPFREAIRAVSVALRSLRKTDRFNVILFDHEYEAFHDLKSEDGPLAPATPAILSQAESWLERKEPQGGGTDIQAPLLASLRALYNLKDSETSSGIPFVLLVTDGCVENEREICKQVLKLRKASKIEARILTYGIGSYSNWYFLKILAEMGRGFSDVAVSMEDIYEGMSRLISCAEKPVLKNIRIRAELEKMTLYPFPIPDLFVGSPLNLSANYEGDFPHTIEMVGDKPGESKECTYEVTAVTDSLIPVEQVFIKQRMDLLTARAWLEESDKIEKKVVELSVRNSIPCAYTTMIAFEMTQEMKDALKEGGEEGKEAGPGIDFSKLRQASILKNKKAMAALAGAGVVAVGAAAFSFGDIAATGMNLDMLGEVMMVGDVGCCCEPGECIECMGSLCPIG